MDSTQPLFDGQAVMRAITAAELQTSGEIRVVIFPRGVDDAVETARHEFHRLGMERTRDRNAVLILVAPASHTFAVFGDEGVHARCGAHFWRDLTAGMESHFRARRFTEGMVHAVEQLAVILAREFPRKPDDTNELPDDVVERGVVI